MATAALPHVGSGPVDGLLSSVHLGSAASAYGTEERQAFPPRRASHGARRLMAEPSDLCSWPGSIRTCRLRTASTDVAPEEPSEAGEQADEADEAFAGTVPRTEVPAHARAGQTGRGHRFAAYPPCSTDHRWRARVISRIRAWLANPVELEWDQSPDWCELAGRRALGVLSKWASILAFRTAPLGLMLFAIGFLVIGRIPGGGGPIPWRVQIIFAAPLLVSLLLPYLAIRTGLVKVRRGEGLRASLRTRTLEVIGTRGVVKRTAWTSFEAFDFGVCEGFPVLKLRVRDKWPFRGHRPTMVVALHVGDSHVQTSAIRQVLGRRGLHEEPLGEPTC